VQNFNFAIASESKTLVYFAFGGWLKKFVNLDSNNVPFSYHRKVGYAAVLGMIMMILLAETTALHLLLLSRRFKNSTRGRNAPKIIWA